MRCDIPQFQCLGWQGGKAAKRFLALLLILSAPAASAIPIDLPGDDDSLEIYKDEARRDTCRRAASYENCVSVAYVSAKSLDATDFILINAFSEWRTLPANSGWTMIDGGALPGGTFRVDTLRALARSTVGGAEFKVSWVYDGNDKNEFFWSQPLYNNYDPAVGGFVDPVYKMDVATGRRISKPPLYPFQYDDRSFYDRPLGPWPDGFFHASAFLTKVDYTTSRLTVFEGISWGFDLSADPVSGIKPVPLPATVGLLSGALLLLLAVLRRSGSSR
jgi:hypothetical protein